MARDENATSVDPAGKETRTITSSSIRGAGTKKPYISRLVVTFQECLGKLNSQNDTPAKLEQMSVIIHECMSSGSRNYHSVQHVFDISKNISDPIGIIAALFHDCIYYNVDGGLSPLQMEMLEGVFKMDGEEVEEDTTEDVEKLKPQTINPYRKRVSRRSTLKQHDDWCVAHRGSSCCLEDPLLCMVTYIFGYPEGTEITGKNGINEFLSAVVAVRQLEPHLTREQLARIACCIEATIPFKNTNETHQHCAHMEQLYQNMINARNHFGLRLTDDHLVETVQLAALLANEDIGNFGTEDRYWFLDNTWSLLPETNTSLRQQFLYTVMEFHQAVYNMYGFFNFLNPNVIFSRFRGVPSEERIDKLTAEAGRNLALGKKYVGAKLLSASVLAAFAHLTGGDTPICLFMGDLPSRHHHSERLEDSLPVTNPDNLKPDHCDIDMYEILARGRKSETSFDTKQSPLAAYLYGELGDDKLQFLLKTKTLYPMNDDNAKDLLKSLTPKCRTFLAKIMASMAVSRSDALLKLLDDLPGEDRTGL